jgi:hypothetical protein
VMAQENPLGGTIELDEFPRGINRNRSTGSLRPVVAWSGIYLKASQMRCSERSRTRSRGSWSAI